MRNYKILNEFRMSNYIEYMGNIRMMQNHMDSNNP